MNKKCECICHQSEEINGHEFTGYCHQCIKNDCSYCTIKLLDKLMLGTWADLEYSCRKNNINEPQQLLDAIYKEINEQI